MLARRPRPLRVLLVLALIVATFGACGDDDDTTESGGGEGENAASVTMREYNFLVDGELTAGSAAITMKNTGKEFHMVGLGKLKAGKTLSDVQTTLSQVLGGAGEGGSEEHTTTSEASRGAVRGQVTSTTEATEESGGGEEEGGDPLEALFEEGAGDEFSGIVQPGHEQTVTADLAAGTYAMICYIPTEGEGTPHAAKGMVSELKVGSGTSEAAAPEADASYTLSDLKPPSGPKELDAGTVTVKLTSDAGESNEFIVAHADPGKTFDDLDNYFNDLFEGEQPPPKGTTVSKAPGDIIASIFSIPSGKSVYLSFEVEAGDYAFVNTTDTGDEDNDSSDQILEVKVS